MAVTPILDTASAVLAAAREVMRTILLKDPEMVKRMTEPATARQPAADADATFANSSDAAPPPPDTTAPGPPALPDAPLPDTGLPTAAPQ